MIWIFEIELAVVQLIDVCRSIVFLVFLSPHGNFYLRGKLQKLTYEFGTVYCIYLYTLLLTKEIVL